MLAFGGMDHMCHFVKPRNVSHPIDAVAPAELSPPDRPRPGDRPAHGSLGAGPRRHGAGRPAYRRAEPGQVAPDLHDEAARPGTDDAQRRRIAARHRRVANLLDSGAASHARRPAGHLETRMTANRSLEMTV